MGPSPVAPDSLIQIAARLGLAGFYLHDDEIEAELDLGRLLLPSRIVLWDTEPWSEPVVDWGPSEAVLISAIKRKLFSDGYP